MADAARGAELVPQLSEPGNDIRDAGQQDLDNLRAFLNADLYAFAQLIFGYRDLIPTLHGDLAAWIADWGYVWLADGRKLYFTEVSSTDIIVRDSRRIMTQIPREFFKCDRNSIVSTTTGPKLVENLCVGDSLLSLDDSFKLSTNTVVSKSTTIAPLLLVTLSSGLHLTCTPNHPWRTVSGWVTANNLTPGTGVATARRLTCPPSTGLLPYTAGAFCGDGCMAQTTPTITCFDTEIIDACRAEGAQLSSRAKVGVYSLLKSSSDQLPKSMRVGSWDKTIPPEYEGSAEFLSGLYDTDGTVNRQNGVLRYVNLVTVSEQLAEAVQRNLRYFGIVARRSKHKTRGPNNYTNTAWHINFSGWRNAERFQKHIGFKVTRKALRLAALVETRHEGTSSRQEAVPPEWRDLLSKSTKGRNLDGSYGGSESSLLSRQNIRVDNRYWTSRQKILKVASILNRPDIAALASDDVCWDQVKSIQPLPENEVVQLEVTGNHTYIANCILSHNTSIGTRANVLWQLCREPHLPVAIFNEEQGKPEQWIRAIRSVVMGNRIFQDVYKDLLPPSIHYADSRSLPRYWKWSDSEMDFCGKALGEAEASLSGHGVTAATTGGHWPKMVLDDIIGMKHKLSQVEMERTREWFRNHVYLMRPAENSMCYINCTTWTYTDVYRDAVRDFGYRVYRRSALELPDGTPDVARGESIFPKKLSTATLRLMYKRDPFSFNAQMQNLPTPGREQSFDPASNRLGSVITLDNGEPAFAINPEHYSPEIVGDTWNTPKPGDPPPPRVIPLKLMDKCLILDPAPTEPSEIKREPHARNAIVVVAQDPWGRRFQLEAWADRADYFTIIAKCFELAAKWSAPRLHCEEVVFSNVYRHWIARERAPDGRFPNQPLDVHPLTPAGREKHARILATATPIQRGLWYFNESLCTQFLVEQAEYPNSATIDLLDAFAYAGECLHMPLTQHELRRARYLEHKGGPYSDPYYQQDPQQENYY